LTTVCLPQSPLSSIHSDVQSIPSPSHAGCSTAGDLGFDLWSRW